MNNKKPRRINYRVNYCSSEDNQYPVSELVLQSAESKGWQSKRFATFPQTVIIELLQLSMVTNLSFLSHQTKICTKIQIQGKQDHQQNWSRLGYTTLQSGTNTNYQSRELRNISIGGKLILLLKFTFHQNYANHINIFNQIGLIALLVYGQKATVERQMVRSKQGQVIANLYELDRETIMKLKNLQQSKKQATENDDFEAAKDLKNKIQTLQANLKALIILQKQKKQAIRKQYYDQAKQITQRMKKLRGPMLSLPKTNQNQQQNNQSYKYDFTPKKRLKNSSHSSMNNYQDPEKDKFYQIPSRNSQRKGNESFDLNPQNANLKNNRSHIIPFDDIVINSKERYPIDEQLQNGINYSPKNNLPPRYKNVKKPNINQREDNESILPNISSNSPPKKLQKLNPEEYNQCSRYFNIFNQVTFEYIYSKQHIHRQKGLKIINETLENFNIQENKKMTNQFVTASLFVVNKLMNDKIISVLTANIDFFGLMMKKLRPNSSSSTSKFIQSILTILAEYLGHNNQKFRQMCQDVFTSLPAHGLTNKDLCFQILCKNVKDKRFKIIVGRLNTLSRIVFKFGADKAAEDLIDFGKSFLEDKSSDVRAAATNLMVQLSKQIGYQNLYPQIQNMKPFVIKMIQQKIQSQGGIIQKSVIKNNKSNFKPDLVIKKNNKLPTNPEYYCDYCKQFDKRFQDDNFRDKHLYSNCRMIILCPQCQQAIQISNMTNHLLSQCQHHKYFKKCAKCKQAIAVKQYNQHTKMKECLSSKPPSVANRCPLCHEDIQSGQAGWIKHLVHEKCPQNPKK